MSMSRTYRCLACENEVDQKAAVCSSPACRKALAFCSHCRDITTYTLVRRAAGKLGRDRLRCDRCRQVGARCLTWVGGGYCNGLARAGGKDGAGVTRPLCASCEGRVGEMARGVAGHAVMGAVGFVLKRRK